MAEVIARVGKITGEAFARDPDGNVRRLKSGDPIREGDVVQTAEGGQVQLTLADGRELLVGANEAAKIDAEVAAPDLPNAGDSAVQNNPRGFIKVAKAIVGPDGTFSFDDDGGQVKASVDQKDGHTFIELVRIVENVDPLAFQFGTGRGQPLDEIRGGRIGNQAATAFTFAPPETENISLSGSEDSPLRIDLKGSDLDGIIAGYVIRSLPANGLLYVDAAMTQLVSVGQTVLGPVFFKPNDNWNGKTSFQYASIDNTGSVDETPAVATIDIAPVNDVVSLAILDANGIDAGQDSVAEDASTTGSFTIGAPDGLDQVAALTIAGTAVSNAALEGSGTTPVVVTTVQGTLTITGYNLMTGVVSYSYDPSGTAKDHTGGEIVDAISIVVRDNNGDMQSGMLNINILDTVPLAHPDANAITEDAAIDTVGGNVIDIGAGKDTLGADATSVTGVVAGTGAPGNNVAAGSTSTAGATVVTGQYGSLLLGADGSYSYRLDNTNAAVNALKDTETLSETFTYTITDADGDPSTTTLTLTINGTTDGGPSIVAVDGNAGATGQASVLEAGLTGPATTETTSGMIIVGSPDGLTSVKVGGVTLTVAQLQALSVGSPQVIDTGEGTLTLTGFSGTGPAPLSGDISYTYTLKAALNQPGATESSDLIALEVTDRGNVTTTGTLTVQIVDDTPTANADSNSVTEGTTSADSTVSGNVFSGSAPDVADRLGADTRANPVTAVSFGGAPQTVGSAFATAYGHLTLNADGSYSYRLDNNNAAVNALKDTETLSETFTYTITDADGDPSTTTLTLTINGTTDGGPSIVPVDGNAGATGQASVLEAGLTGPATTETTSGTIIVGSPDGLTSVKVGGVTLTVAQLQALSVGSPQVIDTGEGTLTLTGFSGTGPAPLSGDISYTYTLKAALNQPGATESSDLIALEVTDRGGITTTGTLTVQIVDDTPTANADSNSVTEGTTSADSTVSGNVFSGSAPDVADRLGADARSNPVTAVSFGGNPQTVGSEFATAYGHLTLNADGSYSYRLDNTNAAVNALKDTETLSETFTYTITDADGDPSTTTLTLTINGTTDGGPSIVPVDGNAGATGQASVLEAGLTGPATTETTSGTINVGSPDGLTSVKVGGVTLTVAQLQALSVGSPQVIDTGEGTLTLTGFSGTGSAPLGGDISYTYTLKAALNQPGASESSDLIALEVTDRGNVTTTGTLTVQIVDDTPTANADSNSVTEGTTSADSTVSGNVFSGSAPDVADRLGADTRANPVTAVSFGGAPQTVGSAFATAYGHLTLNADGSYSYRLDNNNAAVNALKDTETLSETFTYTITDADGDPSTTTLTLTINGTTDGGPSIVPVDGNAGATGQASVLEAGLTGPATTETTSGTINVGSPDGLTSVKVGGVTLTVAQLQALSVGSPQVIDTGEGTLTLTGFSGTGSAPLGGDISYTYTLKAALNQPGASESSDLIALEVTDRGNVTTTGTLTVQIVDDTPTANADSNSVTEGTTSADSTVSGNVFSGSAPDVADRLGADTRANPVTAVSFGGAPQTVGSAFATAYGHLTLNADGSYSYRLDNNNAAVNALKDTETLSETFTYTITDADGDPSTTTLTLTINGTTDGGPSIVPVDGNAGATGQASVLEAGLTGPATTETTSGTINVGSPDGLTSVKVGGVTLTVAQLQALSVGSPQVIDTGEGTLTLTGFSGTGSAPLGGDISYTYTLKAALNQPGASESSDLIALEVTDRGNVTTTGTLTVQIVDDTPTANADSNEISEDALPNVVSGNVMTTGAGQDILSADATRVTGAVVGTGTPGGNVAAGTTSANGTTVAGLYGSIRIGADGSYSYTLDNTKASVQALNAGESTTETFTYTITDADGDPSTTTVNITIRGTDDGVALTVPDANAGATGNASVPENGTLTGQTFTIGAPDGLDATAALTIAGSPVTKAALENSATSNVTINTPEGVLTITGYNPVTGVVTYSYDPSGTAKNHTGGEVLDTISIVVKDDNGDTQPGNLVINIVDTAPLARPDTNTVTEDTAPNPVAGNVITTGGGADTLGADATVVTGIMAGSGTPGNNVASGTTSVNGTSVNGTYGTLVLGADGSYSYTLDNARPAVQALARNQAVSETFTYTITDADGDPSSTTLTITVTGTNDAPIISVGTGDSASANLVETNSGLSTAGTLSISDIDILDTVVASKLDALTVGGTYSGPRPTDAQLKAMFAVTGGEPSTSAQDNPNGINWTFNSGSEAFNSIPAGQTLILTYTVRATDSQGAFVDQPVTITITGTNDSPVAVANTAAVIEDAADQSGYNDSNTGTTIVGGNVLTNDADVDTADTRSVTGVAAGTPASSSGNVATSVAGTYGNVSIAADGSYTYTLDNTKPGVQALASGQNVTDTFSYTITDSQGATSTTTLNVTVRGANDRPDITVGTGDTASVTLVETNSALTTSGTLSIFDIDTTNTVAASKLSVAVNAASTYTGPQPTNLQLLAMFTVAGGNVLSNTQQSNPNGISWAFNSGSQNFDFLPAGQTLVLDYVVRARDSSGVAASQDDTQVVRITITGTNDAGTIVADTISGPETGTITGNVLSNDLPDPDNNEALSVSAVTLDTNGDGSQDSYVLGTTINITSASGGILGSFVMNSSGAYTFTPRDANYSGAVPVITYTAGNATFSDSKTLTITVNPVSDVPGVTVDAANTSTPEDTHVALGFNAPTVSDAIDQNGPGVSGDNPERLGLITLNGIPAGAQLLDGTNSNLVLHLAAGGAITILLSDATNLISSPGAATLTMTTAQFEALRVLPAANNGSNLSVSMSVTSFEVDNAGSQISGVAGAVSSTVVNIDVLAVTDTVDLKINGTDGPYDATIQEDSALDLKALLSTTFQDLDGSEVRFIDLAGLPVGSVVNGVVVGVAGTASIQLLGNNTLPAISLIPPANFSGDINGITVTLRAKDTDTDSTVTTLNETDSVTLNLHVNPVAGDVTVGNVATPEDTAVKFLQGVALTDTDSSESIAGIVVKSVPAGWVLKDDAGTVVFTGNGVATYTIPSTDIANNHFKDYTLTPPAHSSANVTISLDLTTTDSQTVNGSLVTNTQTVTRSETITVSAVAEIVGGDSNGDTVSDLTMTPGFVYTSQGAEDQWFNLNSDGFNLKANWANQDADGSEQTFALLTPVLSGGSAIGSQFRYTDGSGVHVLTYNGTAVEIPMAYLNTVQFMAAPNVAGAFTIGVQARTVDTDPDTGASVSAVSGSATLTNLFIAPVADAVTLAVTGSVTGNEDTLIPLRIKPTSADPSETFNVTISNIPAGSTLVYDGTPVTITGNSATIANFDSTKSLAIQPPANSNTDFSLNVSAVSIDTVGGVTSTSSPTALTIAVDVRGVADSPAITSASLPFVTTEAAVDSGAKRIALSSIITSAALTDSDGSETLSFVLSGLPAGFTVEGLTFTGGVGAARVWAGTAAEFATARIVVLNDNYSGSFDFKFRAITTENDGNSLTGNWVTVPVQVTPSPDATINTTTAANEDTLTRVDFALQTQNGDSNETLSSVWIKAADLVGKPFTLYLDSAGATPLTSLAVDDGWYKLTALQAANVFVKGTANSDADGTVGIRYAITDPSNDSSLPAVTQQFDTNYSIAVNPVTDATTSSNDFVSRVIASTEVVTVNVTVTQNNDPNAGNAKDIDGSEKLLYFIVDSVPLGVTVVGGKYIGNTPGNPNTGRWILDIADTAFSGASLTQAVQFSLDGTAGQLSGLTQAISITAYTQDTGASAMATSTTNWTLQTSSTFADTSPLPTTPAATIATWAKDPAVPGMTEDTPVTLNTLLDARISGTSPFAVTLTGLPAGTVVTGMMMTMVGGAPVWSAQGSGDNGALQALLNGITVTAPANANSNTGPLGFSATLTTYDDGGGRHDSNLTVSLPVTPVSDPIVLVATDSNVSEDSLAPISIALSNVADGANTNVVGGKVYVRLDESGMEAAGGVLRFNGNPVTATTVSGVSGIADGTYFVLNGVSNGSTLNLTYQPAANASGTVGYTAFVQNQETGAANVVTSSTSGSFDINKVNDGVTLSAGNVTGAEDQAVQLAISAALIDSGERIQSVTLSHVPDGFQVYYGNGAPGTAATNMGGGVWSIPASAGAAPAYISLIPPPNWSGTVSGVTAEVWSGETGLDQTVNSANFDVTFNGVADGILISPTLSFGNEGQVVPLNLNSAMSDMDGSETAIITVKGLGSFAAFYAGSSLLSASYDSGLDTYTLSGLSPAQVSSLGVIQKDGSFELVITAQTADSPGGNLSAVVSASMHVDINPVAATTGDDRLLYDGSALNGLAGVDTIEFRLGENLDFSTSPVKPSNIERFDLMPAGQNHSLGHLSVQDVLDMTGSGKSLTILGDSGDSVSLKSTVGGTWSAGGSQTVDGHNFDVYVNSQDAAIKVLIEQQIIKSIDP